MRGKFRLFVDQFGDHFYANSIRELRTQVPGRCTKMYVDRKDGTTVHIGYVIGQHWLTMFEPVELPAGFSN
jgi:hypothetical protein